jgi:hypothetical protein
VDSPLAAAISSFHAFPPESKERIERKNAMQHPSLETITERLIAQARCELDDLCLLILQQVSRGKPLTMAMLGASLQMNQDELEQRLSQVPDTEFD